MSLDHGVIHWLTHHLPHVHHHDAPSQPANDAPPEIDVRRRQLAGWNNVYAQFTARRAGRYVEWFEDLRRCSSPLELAAAQQRWFAKSVQDYADLGTELTIPAPAASARQDASDTA